MSDSLKDVVLLISAIGTLVLGVKTIQQNRRAADRTVEANRSIANDATKVDRERLGLDVLEASLNRVVTELEEERRWNRQLVAAMRLAGIPIPDREPSTA